LKNLEPFDRTREAVNGSKPFALRYVCVLMPLCCDCAAPQLYDQYIKYEMWTQWPFYSPCTKRYNTVTARFQLRL